MFLIQFLTFFDYQFFDNKKMIAHVITIIHLWAISYTPPMRMYLSHPKTFQLDHLYLAEGYHV